MTRVKTIKFNIDSLRVYTTIKCNMGAEFVLTTFSEYIFHSQEEHIVLNLMFRSAVWRLSVCYWRLSVCRLSFIGEDIFVTSTGRAVQFWRCH